MGFNRKIVVISGSKSDHKQMKAGLKYLKGMQDLGQCKLAFPPIVASIHRNTDDVLAVARFLNLLGTIDVVITAAGMANQLTGTFDAYLRNTLKNTSIHVLGVAMRSEDPELTQTAQLSIKNVPGTKVIYQNWVGSEGFLDACKYAVEWKFPPIELKEPPTPGFVDLEEILNS